MPPHLQLVTDSAAEHRAALSAPILPPHMLDCEMAIVMHRAAQMMREAAMREPEGQHRATALIEAGLLFDAATFCAARSSGDPEQADAAMRHAKAGAALLRMAGAPNAAP